MALHPHGAVAAAQVEIQWRAISPLCIPLALASLMVLFLGAFRVVAAAQDTDRFDKIGLVLSRSQDCP